MAVFDYSCSGNVEGEGDSWQSFDHVAVFAHEENRAFPRLLLGSVDGSLEHSGDAGDAGDADAAVVEVVDEHGSGVLDGFAVVGLWGYQLLGGGAVEFGDGVGALEDGVGFFLFGFSYHCGWWCRF